MKKDCEEEETSASSGPDLNVGRPEAGSENGPHICILKIGRPYKVHDAKIFVFPKRRTD